VLRYLSGEAVARGWDVVTPPPGLEVPTAEGASGVEEDVAATLADLRARAASRPTLLLVDEVESAPDRSVRLLERIAREGKGAPLRVVAAVRAAELRHPGARKLLDDLGIVPTLRRLDLEPLDSGGIRAMASRATGGDSVSESRVKWLRRNSEGNPLVAESLLVEGAWEQRSRRKTHTSLAESVALRLAMLSPEALEWLRALCVLGDDVAGEMVADLAGLNRDTARPASEEASAAGLVRERRGRWSTDSRLVREQVLANISVDRQREFFTRAAKSLVGTGEADPWRLAHLWSSAGEADQAVRQAVVAAETSLGRRDTAEAAQRFGYALRHLGRGDPRRRDLRMRQGAAFLDAERYEPAIRAYGSTVRLSRTRPERADALGRQAHALALAGRFKRAKGAATEAVDIARNLDLRLEEARANRILGILLGRAGQLQEAFDLFEKVLPVFEKEGDLLARAETLHGLASSSLMLGQPRGREAAEIAIDAFTSLGLASKALKSKL
jgi:tetratricopeptide (TPR) repeat protein